MADPPKLFVYDPDFPRRDEVLAGLLSYVERRGKLTHISVSDPKRSLEQNARLWACLGDVSKQVQWPVDGKLQRLSSEDWKHLFSASLAGHSRMALGLEGGVVMLGQSTSRMTKAQLSDLLELISAFGNERGVIWSETYLGETK